MRALHAFRNAPTRAAVRLQTAATGDDRYRPVCRRDGGGGRSHSRRTTRVTHPRSPLGALQAVLGGTRRSGPSTSRAAIVVPVDLTAHSCARTRQGGSSGATSSRPAQWLLRAGSGGASRRPDAGGRSGASGHCCGYTGTCAAATTLRRERMFALQAAVARHYGAHAHGTSSATPLAWPTYCAEGDAGADLRDSVTLCTSSAISASSRAIASSS